MLIVVALLALAGCGLVAYVVREGTERLADSLRAGISPEERAAFARIAELHADYLALRRAFTDLDDSVEHRFNRLNARGKREEKAAADSAPAPSADTLELPFGAVNRPAFPARNGAPQPLGFGRAQVR